MYYSRVVHYLTPHGTSCQTIINLMQVSSEAKAADGKENFVLKEDTVSTSSSASSDGPNSRVNDKLEKGG